nr:MAG TPA: hypothetical protein [Caudoviricetes sp.]
MIKNKEIQIIGIRSIVAFISKNRDDSKFIVREINCNGTAKIQSLRNMELFTVPISDLKIITSP